MTAPILLLAEQAEEQVNITPMLLKFTGKFFAIFAIVAVVTVLTPWMAKKVDAFREKHQKEAAPEDPRCKAVRGPYDMPEPAPKRKKPAHPAGERPRRPAGERPKRKPRPEQEPKTEYQPKH
jgi:hypothetical protein